MVFSVIYQKDPGWVGLACSYDGSVCSFQFEGDEFGTKVDDADKANQYDTVCFESSKLLLLYDINARNGGWPNMAVRCGKSSQTALKFLKSKPRKPYPLYGFLSE